MPVAAKDIHRVKFGAADVNGLQEDSSRKRDHAMVNGKPVIALAYPEALQEDPNIETVVGKYAYGFDLGGPEANKFIDPETHEKVDDQLFRAVGCSNSFQSPPPLLPYSEGLAWNAAIDTAPGWAIQITGADLSKDGPVTITLDRTLRHLDRDAQNNVRVNGSYVLDPDVRSHNVLHGEIKDGMLTIKPANVYLEGTLPFYTQIDLKNAHMRFHSGANGNLLSYWGGYTDWHRWVYMTAARPPNADPVGWYQAMKKLADADPDPVTGTKRLISTTWRVEAVPAFLMTENGKILATATVAPLGGVVAQVPAFVPAMVGKTEDSKSLTATNNPAQ